MDLEGMANILRALGHPTRLMIISELIKGQRCVGEMESILHTSQANTSQHLAILKTSGIVDCRHIGNTRCYFLKEPGRLEGILERLEGYITK